jgi:hypothetical protein
VDAWQRPAGGRQEVGDLDARRYVSDTRAWTPRLSK